MFTRSSEEGLNFSQRSDESWMDVCCFTAISDQQLVVFCAIRFTAIQPNTHISDLAVHTMHSSWTTIVLIGIAARLLLGLRRLNAYIAVCQTSVLHRRSRFHCIMPSNIMQCNGTLIIGFSSNRLFLLFGVPWQLLLFVLQFSVMQMARNFFGDNKFSFRHTYCRYKIASECIRS